MLEKSAETYKSFLPLESALGRPRLLNNHEKYSAEYEFPGLDKKHRMN